MSSAGSDHADFERNPGIEYGLIKAHAYAALASVILAALFGLLISTKMHLPDMAAKHAFMSWGRLRYDHTQGIFFGWLGNAFLLFLYYAVPKLAKRPVFSQGLGKLLFFIWNFAVLIPGLVLCLLGNSQSLEWAEFPLLIDGFVVFAFLLSIIQFVVPILKSGVSKLYVSGWYIIGGMIFTALAYPVGNIVPQLLPGAQGAAFSGLWIHDAIGLYVTPLALAVSYLVIPLVTGRPIYSHFLSMIGFWLLFFVYPLNGTHHYVYSALPMEAQQGAILASVILGVDVLLVVANLLLSLKGSGNLLKENIPLRFVWMGTIFYLLVSLQGSMQALMPVNKLVHFSDWVIGHSHLAMLGFASFTAIGGMTHVWQNMPGANFNLKTLKICYWHLLAGLLLMVVDLTLAGLVEASAWQSWLPWLDSLRAAKHFFEIRTLSGLLVIAGFILLILSMTRGAKNGALLKHTEIDEAPAGNSGAEAKKAGSLLSMAYLSASVAGIAFFVLSFGLLGVVPGYAIESDVNKRKPPHMMPLTEAQERGRLVYAREGCAYCHTQQVRAVASDTARFGNTTQTWETIYDYPQLWGTRRVGPDLAREGKTRSDDWQLAHLYNPRLTVPDSIMPPYPWLFEADAKTPTKEGQDLLAYIKSLGQARELAGARAEFQEIPSYCFCADEIKNLERAPTAVTAYAAAARRNHSSARLLSIPEEPVQLAAAVKSGSALFKENCSSCHGATGRGDGPAAALLMPPPADLTVKEISRERMSFVLANGVYGSSMPAWRDLPESKLSALATYVQTLSKVSASQSQDSPALSREAAKLLYSKNCVSCHGADGGGNGPVAAALAPAPTNFKQVRPSKARALVVINDGIPGTSMPPWKDQLSLLERAQLADYVSSLYTKKIASGVH
ncbi:MAG: cbb3-type cytochrome c oxidase subunit I [Candidatus Obscuribacterales bacterium]|nr:cbb3-type cytochrome c oxidase subunit I [Candidatus Obscuribacterales bacterium]